MSKAEFVKKLRDFYVNVSGNARDISDMDYVQDGVQEWVYVTINQYSFKRFSVTGDNNNGILIDFGRFLADFKNYEYLLISREDF